MEVATLFWTTEKPLSPQKLNYTCTITLYVFEWSYIVTNSTFHNLSFPRQLIKSVTELFNSY